MFITTRLIKLFLINTFFFTLRLISPKWKSHYQLEFTQCSMSKIIYSLIWNIFSSLSHPYHVMTEEEMTEGCIQSSIYNILILWFSIYWSKQRNWILHQLTQHYHIIKFTKIDSFLWEKLAVNSQIRIIVLSHTVYCSAFYLTTYRPTS